MSDTEPFAVQVHKDFGFSPEQVFDAWLDPAMVEHWFAPELETMTRIDIDAREGGMFHLDQQRGDEIARHWGTYREIDRPRRLVFTWCVTGDEESLVTIDFEPTDTGCRVTLTHEMDPAWADYSEQVQWGWNTMLKGIHVGLIKENAPGTREAVDTVRFERLLPGPIEEVWAWLTQAERRALWLAGGELPAREGENFQLEFDHNSLSPDEVVTPERFREMEPGITTEHCLLQFNPPHKLQFSWGEGEGELPSEVTFELQPEGDQVRLIVTHILLTSDAIPMVAGGWHTHLAILGDRLAGISPPAFWALFEDIETRYRERFARNDQTTRR